MSRIGGFISEDTYEGDTKNPLSLNLYTYVYNNPTRYHDPSGNVSVLIALIGKQVLNYGLDVMIGVGTDYLNHLNTKSGTFNVKASIKKNAKESIVPGLGFLKKIKKAYKLADGIKDALKKAKKAKVTGGTAKKVHGNSHSTTKPAEGYSIRDKDTGQVLKYVETTRVNKRYSKKYYKENNAEMVVEARGTKKEMHKWQHDKIVEHKKNNNGQRPPKNKSDY